MSSSFFKYIYTYFIIIILLILFVCLSVVQISTLSSSNFSGSFVWPIPDYTYISSYFGYRTSPTAGASSYHSGIDIPASEGTPILSVCDGIVTFASWGAGGGYTIVVENNSIKAGSIISNVGPKNVYGIQNNPYKDSSGNPTNGATTGCHLHLTIKKDGIAVNPLDFFNL